MRECEIEEPKPLPQRLLNEFMALLGWGAFIETELTAGWNRVAYQVDSAAARNCVVWTQASVEEIQAEARFAERRGWLVRVEKWFVETEMTEEVIDEDGLAGRAPPRSFKELVVFARDPVQVVMTSPSGAPPRH